MSQDLFTNLAWLPKPPENFSSLCKDFTVDEPGAGLRLRALANFGLSENHLNRLAKVIERARARSASLAPLIPFKLGIVSNATSHFIAPALVATAARHGLILECIEADYGMVVQEALDPNSIVNQAKPDAILLALDYRGLPLHATPADEVGATQAVAEALAHVMQIRDGLRANGGGVCIFQSVAPPVETLFGSFDAVLPGTLRNLIHSFNAKLAEAVRLTEDLFFDVTGLAETIGLANWHDPTMWNMAKVPFASAYIPLYADKLCRLVSAMRGKGGRCLILDLDNTLWSGVIGDDGLDGIVIGQGDATGEAHLEVQKTAINLRDRGIILAVSSKNNDDIAREPFRKHPEMLLREDHIAVFQANWNDKATNIKAIAEELSLGLDAMVFLDDNPVERALVRQILPEVSVPELPEDPALYARTLVAGGYFEAVTFSAEDRQRAEMYQGNSRRLALQKQAGDVASYLRSLNMQIGFMPFDEMGRARISQLINKSNQFNLRTQRYTEAQVATLQQDPSAFTLQIRLRDVFGDNGMICVVICRKSDDTSWFIDTWLMSCRVLGRGVEQATLTEMVAQARRRGIRRLVGEYIPTSRNKLVEDHYAKLGFEIVNRSEDGSTRWELSTEVPLTFDIYMSVDGLVAAE